MKYPLVGAGLPRSYKLPAMLPPLSFFSLGFISTALQVILLRQMAVSFGGNEMAWGVILSSWLLWAAAGSFAGGKIAPQISSPRRALTLSFFLLSIISPLLIISPKIARWVFGLPPGQIVGIFPLTLAAFFITALPCWFLGLLFTLNARWTQEEKQETRFGGMIAVYWWEALGAAAGGLYPSFLFYAGVGDEYILYSLTPMGVILALCLTCQESKAALSWKITGGVLLLVLAFAGVIRSKDYLIQQQWGSHQLKASMASIYGQIDVLTYEEQISFYQNGLLSFSYPDQMSAEEAVHYALLQHPLPQRVLLIGTGMGGAIREALKHPELTLTYIELDPALINAADKYLPSSLTGSLNSLRVKIIRGDARPWLVRREEVFDVIILNLPGPANAQLNRYYTNEFFEAVKAHLRPQGIFFFKVAAAEDYWSPNLLRYLNTLRRTLEISLPEVLVIPGENALYFAGLQKGVLTADPGVLSRRYRERKLSNQFVNPRLLPFRLRSERIKEFREKLDSAAYEINQDLRPVSYLYDSILWSAQFGGWEQKIMGALSRVKPYWMWLVFLLSAGLLFLFLAVMKGYSAGGRYLCLLANGLTTIALEIIILLLFQIYYGYVYFFLGILIALFMVGLSLGSWGGRKYELGFTGNDLIFLQAVLLSIPFGLWLFLRGSSVMALSPAPGTAFLFLFMLSVGTLGGLHFAAFSRFLLAEQSSGTKTREVINPGGPYAADLAGSSLGALLLAALFIPLMGIASTLILLSAFNLIALIILVGSSLKRSNNP